MSASLSAITPTRRIRSARCFSRNAAKRRVGAIDEVSEHMDVTAVVHGRDLDAWNEGDPRCCRRGLDFRQGRHGVVVGHAHGPDAGAPGEIDKDSRLAEAIRRGCMKMEIDDVRSRHAVSR